MKKKFGIVLCLIIGIFSIFFIVKQATKQPVSEKPILELNIYTISAEDTKRWEKVKEFDTKEAKYLLEVKEEVSSEDVFKHLISDGTTSVGVGITKEKVLQYNNNLDKMPKNSKNNKLIGIEFFTFSTEDKGLVIANFDYGSEELNSQKKKTKELYQKLFEASEF